MVANGSLVASQVSSVGLFNDSLFIRMTEI